MGYAWLVLASILLTVSAFGEAPARGQIVNKSIRGTKYNVMMTTTRMLMASKYPVLAAGEGPAVGIGKPDPDVEWDALRSRKLAPQADYPKFTVQNMPYVNTPTKSFLCSSYARVTDQKWREMYPGMLAFQTILYCTDSGSGHQLNIVQVGVLNREITNFFGRVIEVIHDPVFAFLEPQTGHLVKGKNAAGNDDVAMYVNYNRRDPDFARVSDIMTVVAHAYKLTDKCGVADIHSGPPMDPENRTQPAWVTDPYAVAAVLKITGTDVRGDVAGSADVTAAQFTQLNTGVDWLMRNGPAQAKAKTTKKNLEFCKRSTQGLRAANEAAQPECVSREWVVDVNGLVHHGMDSFRAVLTSHSRFDYNAIRFGEDFSYLEHISEEKLPNEETSVPYAPTCATPQPTPTTTVIPMPSVTSVPLPTTTLIPLPSVTIVPTPTVTVIPLPSVTSVPLPTTTEIPLPTVTTRPVPTITIVPARPVKTIRQQLNLSPR